MNNYGFSKTLILMAALLASFVSEAQEDPRVVKLNLAKIFIKNQAHYLAGLTEENKKAPQIVLDEFKAYEAALIANINSDSPLQDLKNVEEEIAKRINYLLQMKSSTLYLNTLDNRETLTLLNNVIKSPPKAAFVDESQPRRNIVVPYAKPKTDRLSIGVMDGTGRVHEQFTPVRRGQ